MTDQLARGSFTGFDEVRSPFSGPNAMPENIRRWDDHFGLFTLLSPQAPGSPRPEGVLDGDGLIYSDGTYETFNGGTWKLYEARRGIVARLIGSGEQWMNTGFGWISHSAAIAQRLASGEGAGQIGFQAFGTGARVRTGLEKMRERVTPEDFGAVGDGAHHPLSDYYPTLAAAQVDYPHAHALTDELDTVAIQAAINSGAREIENRRGAVYLTLGLTLNRSLRFAGRAIWKKAPSPSGIPCEGAIINITTGAYKIEFDDITFDGAWASGYGDPDIQFTASANGLELAFHRCKFNNWSKYSMFNGYPGYGKFTSVLLSECGSNGIGAFKAMAQSETAAAIININYADRVDIVNCNFPGDGNFNLGDGTAAGLVRAPAFAVLCTYCRVTVTDGNFPNSSGIVLYTGCDYSVIENCRFVNCLHAISAQECILPTVRNCTFIGGRAQYRGTVTIQPWARLTSDVGRKQEGLIGALIEGCTFSGNEIDISALGAWLYAGQHGVANTRCRGVRVRDCISIGSVQRPFVGQDVDDIHFLRFDIYAPCQSTTVANAGNVYLLTATGANGHGSILIEGGTIASAGGNAKQVLQSINMTGTSVTMRARMRKTRISGFSASAQPIFYARYADVVEMSEVEFVDFTAEPTTPFKSLDNRECVIRDIQGIAYPANGMEITDTTITVLRSDHRQTARAGRFFATSMPTNTNMPIGTIADVPSPAAAGYLSRVFTVGNVWKSAANISS